MNFTSSMYIMQSNINALVPILELNLSVIYLED